MNNKRKYRIVDAGFRMKEPCKHPKLKFIGFQETSNIKKWLKMYNCKICKSTIISGVKKED